MSTKQHKDESSIPVTGEHNGHGTARGSTALAEHRRASDLTRFGYGRLHPFESMQHLTQEVESLFETLGLGTLPLLRGMVDPALAAMRPGALWSPKIEVQERDGRLIVSVDLPGLTRDDIKVEIYDSTLAIQGERRQEWTGDRAGVYHNERSYGSFRRTIPLPTEIDAADVSANFDNGVLEISMPAPERQREARQIEIGSRK